MSCEFEYDDGAYVLGALSPADRQAFEAHLSGCDRCQRSVRELAGLPGLLARVDAGVLESPAADVPVPAGVLPALLRDVRTERRRRTWLTAGAAAAAAVVVATATFTLAGLNDSGDGPSAAPSATSSSTATGRPMAPVGDVKGVRATLDLAPVAWGTKLDLVCSYAGRDVRGPRGVLARRAHPGRPHRAGRDVEVAAGQDDAAGRCHCDQPLGHHLSRDADRERRPRPRAHWLSCPRARAPAPPLPR